MNLFFDPKEIVKDYYHNNQVNLHNKTSFKAHHFLKKIQSLRSDISNYFSPENPSFFEICFLTSHYSALKILTDNYPDYLFVIISSSTNPATSNLFAALSSLKNVHSFGDIEILKTLDSHSNYFFISEDFSLFADPNLIKEARKINKNWKFYACLDQLLYISDHSFIQNLDFYTFSPLSSLGIFGCAVFGCSKTERLRPSYLGSSSLSVDIDGLDCWLKKPGKKCLSEIISTHPSSFEIGTQNYPALLLLERYFYFLNKHKDAIVASVSQHISSLETKAPSFTINFNELPSC